MTEEETIALIQRGELQLPDIKHQTEKICLAAIKYEIDVEEYGYALDSVHKQTPAICKLSVGQIGTSLKYVYNQTPELCKIAVQQDGWALRYVHNQTPELCKLAVQQYAGAIELVKNQTKELCIIAIKKSPWLLKLVKNQTIDICKIALQIDKSAIAHVNILHLFSIDDIQQYEKDLKTQYPVLKEMNAKEMLKHFRKKKI
jgi:hypothetical protein